MTSASASRVTRSSRSLRRAVLLFAGVLAGITVLRAQETPPVPEPATTTTASPATAKPAAPPAAGPAKPVNPPTNPPATSTSTPARFEPTEKVRADFDVSFPIDI